MNIREYLKSWGFSPHLKGYFYIIKACEFIGNKDLTKVKMQDLVKQVGEFFGISASKVERSMRHAIQDYANINITIKEFLFELAEKIQMGELTIEERK